MCSGVISANAATPTLTSYSNFYVTYMTPNDVQTAVNYAKSQGISRFFMWTVDQDAPATSAASLINAINTADPDATIATYFPNYASYNDQRAIPGTAYTIGGSSADLNPKLNASNELIYAFAETQVPSTVSSGQPVGDNYINTPNSYGSIYMFDPWSDLAAGDTFCGNSNLPAGVPVDANGYNLICGYAFDNQGRAYSNTADYNNFGNFESLAALPASVKGKGGAPIQTSLSIGGFGHNSSFEAIFDPASYGVTTVTQAQAIQNFVNSVVAVLTHYNIDGVDVDYEDVAMTHQQSQDYLTLLTALNTALAPLNKSITIATISNPDYINGSEANNTVGFAPGALQSIANLSQVKAIDVMTYDFSGTFNYGSGTGGTTGFLSNTYMPNDANTPAGYNFDIKDMIDAILATGVPATKVGIGIPAYGRALASLPGPGGANDYLFSPLDSNVIIPAGDQDVANCDQKIVDWQSGDACQGMFSYNFIVKNIVNSSDVDDHQDDDGNAYNGTTIFLPSWNVPGGGTGGAYTLTVNNQDSTVGLTVNVGSFVGAYQGPSTQKAYNNSNNPSASGIQGQSGLPVSFT